MRLKHLLLIITVITFALVILTGCTSDKKGPTLKRGERVPDINFVSTDGGASYSLPAETAGKLTVILFWSEGCPYCKKEMPFIQPVYEKYRDSGFEFVAVHAGPGMEASVAMKKSMGLTFPMVVDKDFRSKKAYGVRAVPSMYVLDAEGRLKERILGGLGAADIEKLIIEDAQKVNEAKEANEVKRAK